MNASSPRPRVLVTRALFPEHLARVAAHFDATLNQADVPIAAADLAQRLDGVDGLLCASGDRIDAALLASTTLRGVSTISVGTNHIDLAACRAQGIVVTNTPDVLTETTADFGWALMMAAARRVTESEHWLRAGHCAGASTSSSASTSIMRRWASSAWAASGRRWRAVRRASR